MCVRIFVIGALDGKVSKGLCARIAVMPKVVGSTVLLDLLTVNLVELIRICQKKGVKLSNPYIPTISDMIEKVETSGKSLSGTTMQL